MGTCVYCGFSHSDKVVLNKPAFDPLGLVKISIKKRSSNTYCAVCGEPILPKSIVCTKATRNRGRFSRTQYAHLDCFHKEIMRIFYQYLANDDIRKQQYKERNKRKAKERYQRITDANRNT